MAEHYTDQTTHTSTTHTSMSTTAGITPTGGEEPHGSGRRGRRNGSHDRRDFLNNSILAKLVINKEFPGDGEDEELMSVVRHRDICFIFTHIAAERRLFCAPWRRDPRVHRPGVYVVTRKGVYRTGARAVVELLRQLPYYVVNAHQGLAANLKKARWYHLPGSGGGAIGFGVRRGQPRESEEWVMLSRQCTRDIKRMLEGKDGEEGDHEHRDASDDSDD